GFPDFPARDDIKAAAINAIENNINQYSITWGSETLRKAIAKKLEQFNNIHVNPEKNITVTCGSTEAMMASLKAIVNPGDEVIVFEPFYENYGPDVMLSGGKTRYVELSPKEWKFEEESLEKSFNEKTKAIIINTPNNPTGKVFSEKELKKIANLCLQHDVIAITDEIYEHIVYDEHSHFSIASIPEMESNSITINSISKTYSLTGWRVGWAVASEKITNEIKKVHDFLTVGAAAPLQEGAAYALSLGDEYYTWLSKFYHDARNSLLNSLKESELEPWTPAGAYYIMCDCTDFMKERGLENSMDLAIHLLKEVGIATVPGESFYFHKNKGEFLTRFCFCKKDETLQKAGQLLQKIKK
ncbi:MAG: pyridoxal phosphate-dependent aminotransferase, partial [Promethearchaeota archaeon]